MAQALTDTALKAVKSPASGRVEIADLRCPGLSFRVTAAGVRSWCFRFRDPSSGKDGRSTIGRYPDVSLAAARDAADTLRRKVAGGVNPVTQKRKDRQDAGIKTFEALANRYMAEHARRFKRSADADDRMLRLHVLPKWKRRRFDQIRRADVIELIEGIIGRGFPIQANRVQALVSKIFSFAVDADLMEANPCHRLRKRSAENKETRVLSDAEIVEFWRRCVLKPVSRPVGLALRLALLTGARESEAAQIAKAELQLTGPEPSWTLPSERSKNGNPLLVPLSALALATIRSAIEIADPESDYLFPSPIEAAGPITGHALTVAMRRMTAKIEGDAAKTWKADPPSPHDLRRTFGTRLSALGVPKEDRDACLNHKRNDVGTHYDLYERAAEKRRALDAWASLLNRLIGVDQ